MALEPILPLHKVVPSWTLPVMGDEATFSLSKPRGRAHTLLVVAHVGVDIVPYLGELAPQLDEFKTLPARGVAIFFAPNAAQISSGDVPDVPEPWKVVLDTKQVRRAYLPADTTWGIFVLDRYNDLYHQWLGSQEAELPLPRDVIEWLESVGRQCSI